MFKKKQYFVRIVPEGTITTNMSSSGPYIGSVKFNVEHNLPMDRWSFHSDEKGKNCARLTGMSLSELKEYARRFNTTFVRAQTADEMEALMNDYVQRVKGFIQNANATIKVVNYEPVAEASD